MNINAYIDRIQYKGELNLSLDTLRGLQKAHLLNVPFENLDIHFNNPIELDLDKIYHKIVVKKRGGFCYELNGLFQHLLEQIGFDSKIISARVYDSGEKKFGEEFDHLAIIVKLGQSAYLIDVGFGEFAFEPLKLESKNIQSDPRGHYIVEPDKGTYYKVSQIKEESKTIEYIFSTQKRDFRDFDQRCNYHQTSQKSHFTHKKLISKPTEKGRISISGNTLKIVEEGIIKRNDIFEEGDFATQLLKWFGIELAEIKQGM